MSWLNLTKRHALTVAAVVIGAAGTMVALPSTAAAAPPMGGGYTNVIAIPVNDPAVKEKKGDWVSIGAGIGQAGRREHGHSVSLVEEQGGGHARGISGAGEAGAGATA